MAEQRRITARIVFNRFPELAAAVKPKASAIVRKAAADVEARAKSTVPVDTGNLKNSIQTEMDGETTAYVGTGVTYGPFIEYGTRRAAAQPFLTPAAEAVRPSFEDAMKELFG